mgnify:CR=1 FL=1
MGGGVGTGGGEVTGGGAGTSGRVVIGSKREK